MRYRFAFALACGLGLSVGAAPAMAEKLFGAIAFSSSTGQYGWARNVADEASATEQAVSGCGIDDCELVVMFPNCAALSVGDGYGMGFSTAKLVAKSEETALARCDEFTTNCIISTSLCNDE